MPQLRYMTPAEISAAESLGSSAEAWSQVRVSEDFTPFQLLQSHLEGTVEIGSGARIIRSRVCNYRIGEGALIEGVMALECRRRSTFGNGVGVATMNECGGRTVRIFDRMSAQVAYLMAVYRHRPQTVAALEHLAQELGGMDLCVVCAGTGDLNPSLDFALEETAILTNVLGWTAAADWAYNRFERQGGGHLVVVSSVGGLRGGGAAPAYNASKAYQINYAEGLRQRAAKSRLPLYVTDVRPGFVDTAMAKGDGLFWVMPVEKAVRQIVRAVRRRRRVAVVTRRWRIAAWLLRHMPDGIYLKM